MPYAPWAREAQVALYLTMLPKTTLKTNIKTKRKKNETNKQTNKQTEINPDHS